MRFTLMIAVVSHCISTHVVAEAPLAEQLAREVVVPRMELREAKVRESLEFLWKKSADQLGPDRVLNINYVGRQPSDARINCRLQNVSLIEALRLIAQQANLFLAASDEGLYLYPVGELPAEANQLREVGWSTETSQAATERMRISAQRDAFLEAIKMLKEPPDSRDPQGPQVVQDVIDRLQMRVQECDERLHALTSRTREEQPPPSQPVPKAARRSLSSPGG